MKILAIETSCDETALAIIEANKTGPKTQFKICANDLSSQIELHRQFGGVFPAMAKREHAKNILPILLKVLKEAKLHKQLKTKKTNLTLQKKIAKILEREFELFELWNETMWSIQKPKIDAVAVTVGPGLEPALWVGINFARALAELWDIPLIPVNHMEGHIFSIFPRDKKTFTVQNTKSLFPMLSLLVSGGHTEIVLVKDWMKYKLIGQTLDDAAGEAFDKVARMLDLPYPGGPEISKLAKELRERGNSIPSGILFPRPMLNSKDYNFSYSGLKTSVLYTVRDLGKLDQEKKEIIAKEFEDAAIEVLVTKTLRAVKEFKIKTLIVGGGVSGNTHLQKTLSEKLQKESPKTALHFPVRSLSTDNALMIAIAGYFQYQKRKPTKNSRRPLLKADGNLVLS